jgi:cell division protein FtsB
MNLKKSSSTLGLLLLLGIFVFFSLLTYLLSNIVIKNNITFFSYYGLISAFFIYIYQKYISEEKEFDLISFIIFFILLLLMSPFLHFIMLEIGKSLVDLIKKGFTVNNLFIIFVSIFYFLSITFIVYGVFIIVTNILSLFSLKDFSEKKGQNNTMEKIEKAVEELEEEINKLRSFILYSSYPLYQALFNNFKLLLEKALELRNKLKL